MEKPNYENGINVLSLFDGCSTAYVALERAGFKINNYYSSEIDKHCIAVQNYHYSGCTNFFQIGDVLNVNGLDYLNCDLVVLGSPCTQLSSINGSDRSGLAGKDSSLFYEALRILKEIYAFQHSDKKLFALIENVQSMTLQNRDKITDELKVIFPDLQMLKIDSALLAPAHRRRLYWTNIPNVTVPQPNGKSYQEIIINGYADREKANVLLSSDVTLTNGIKRYYNMNIGNIIFKDKAFAQLPTEQKLLQYPEILQASGYKSKKGIKVSEYDFVNACYRLPSILERERMMTLPDGYISSVPNVPKSEKRKILGLSFTCDVIAHLLNPLKNLQ